MAISPLSRSRAKTAEPQSPQNTFSRPSPAHQARRRSSPAVTETDPGTIRADAAAAVPDRCWQRVQWQYAEATSGALISKRTAPHPQPPVSGPKPGAATPMTLPRQRFG